MNILASKCSLHHEVKSNLNILCTGAVQFHTIGHASIELKFVWNVVKSFPDKSHNFLLRSGTILLAAVYQGSFHDLLNLT